MADIDVPALMEDFARSRAADAAARATPTLAECEAVLKQLRDHSHGMAPRATLLACFEVLMPLARRAERAERTVWEVMREALT